MESGDLLSALGVGINLDEGSRTSLCDSEVGYVF